MAQPSFQLLHAAGIAALALGLVAVLLATVIHLLRRQLQASRARYREFSDAVQDGVWQTDAAGNILEANRRMGEMLGLPAQELIGRNIRDLFDEATLLRVCALLREDEDEDDGGGARLLDYVRADGRQAWAMIRGKRLLGSQGQLRGALTVATDVTEHHLARQALSTAHADLGQRIALRTAQLQDVNELLSAEIAVRREAEQALAHSETQLQEIISMLPLALFLKTADSQIVLMNQACEQQWGIGLDDLNARTEELYFAPAEVLQFREDDRQAFAQRRVIVRENVLWNDRLQQHRRVLTHKQPIFDRHGRPQLIIGMGIDITERQRTEEALRQSLLQLRELSDHQESIKDAERRRIALDIHDDLGQSLMALKIDVSLLHARTGEKHARLQRHTRRALATIDASITAVRAIINDLYPSTLELGLVPAVEWLVRQMNTLGGSHYHLRLADPDTGEGLDRRQTAALFRVIQESLSNSLRHARASTVEVTLAQCAREVLVRISDDGIGMQPGDDGKRAAFGLKSMRERIHALGGALQIDSLPGQGTTLEIRLPFGVASPA
ncbi:PAS domain-containing sensor histidine kinase [Janthinobacterium sp. PSPC3-1]|uniref:PAS domain-containing sensor histidine kinase n=1 Tax=Janthinobacterium sp. PSPC3-1 TaxID=2804653 RepID=UPI003CEE8472